MSIKQWFHFQIYVDSLSWFIYVLYVYGWDNFEIRILYKGLYLMELWILAVPAWKNGFVCNTIVFFFNVKHGYMGK